jgi:hypothetical protein
MNILDTLTESEINEILTYINNYRKEYDVPNLEYDAEISQISKNNAISYLKSKIHKLEFIQPVDEYNNKQLSKNSTFVKNVRNQKMHNIKHIIKKWHDENKYYDFENDENIKYKACQNFINLVWESNIKCGFGYSYANGKCVFCLHFLE